MATKKTTKKVAQNKTSKADEFFIYTLGISILVMTAALLLLSYEAILQMKHMGK
jgi:hypothetical protein